MSPLPHAQGLPAQNCSLVSDYFIPKPPVSVYSFLVCNISKKCICPVITDSWGGHKIIVNCLLYLIYSAEIKHMVLCWAPGIWPQNVSSLFVEI